jgi:pimeloyl-ACP methyl ester carboxylesterase
VSEEEIIKAGIAAARAGDRNKAGSLFAQVVKVNPSSEAGWFYLAMCCNTTEQREYCFRRVLEINPNNAQAREKLQAMSKPVSSVSTSPFIYEQGEPVDVEKKVSPFSTEAAIASVKPADIVVPQKRSNRGLILTLLGVPALAACVVAGAYVLFSDQMMQWLVPSQPAGQQPVLLATQTLPPQILVTETALPPTALPTAMPTVTYVPRYEETSCPFESPPDVQVTCGYAIVPEDRTGDPSKTIKLAVAVFHSTSNDPAPDPVMFLQGGPGGEAVQLSAYAFDVLVAPFLSDRDYVTFDQRGTGLSEPALKCDELDKVFRQDIYGSIAIDTRELVYKNAFLSCSGLLSVSGINLNSYTTAESAADLKDILGLLGYEKASLYGGSYGTRLALVTMRDHPQVVKSAILDSVVPVEANVFATYPDSVNSALSQLFVSCAVDPKCNAAYPNLETIFWETVHELDTNQITVTTSAYPMGTVTETVDGSYLMSVVLGSIKDSFFIGTAPQTIYRVKGRDYSTLLATQYALPYAFDGINAGLYISMMCHEHGLAATQEQLQAAADRLGLEEDLWRPYYGEIDTMHEACRSWGVSGPYQGENNVVISDIPSLVIEGSYDPATPPFFGRQVADQLSNSFYFEFPNLGHVPTASDTTGCAMDIAVTFLKNPTVEPDRACMDQLPAVEFSVPYTGEPAIRLTEEDLLDVVVDVPEDWFFTFDGFFVRNATPFDITQVGAFRASLTASELKDFFSLGAYGYRGLDGAPVESGTLSVNGLDWKLYIALSNGRPVDIAMADDGGTSLVIMMFCHPDEHDALYRTVFLPMVNSAR